MSIKKTIIYFTNAILLLFDEFMGDPEGAADQISKGINEGVEFIYPRECERRNRETWNKRFVSRLLEKLEIDI